MAALIKCPRRLWLVVVLLLAGLAQCIGTKISVFVYSMSVIGPSRWRDVNMPKVNVLL